MTIYDEFDLDVEHRLHNWESLLDPEDLIDSDHHLNVGLMFAWSGVLNPNGPMLFDMTGHTRGLLVQPGGDFAKYRHTHQRPGASSSLNVPMSGSRAQIDDSVYHRPANITASCFARIQSTGSGIFYHHLICKLNQSGWANPYAAYCLRIDNTDHPECWINNGASFPANYATSANTISINTWYHLAMTHDGSTLRLYQDGTQIATKAIAADITNYSTDYLYLGNAGDNSSVSVLDGDMDEVRIYNRALSASEIVDLRTEHLLGNPRLYKWKRTAPKIFALSAQSGVDADLPAVSMAVTNTALETNHEAALPVVLVTLISVDPAIANEAPIVGVVVSTVAPETTHEAALDPSVITVTRFEFFEPGHDLPAATVTLTAVEIVDAAILPAVTVAIASASINAAGTLSKTLYFTTDATTGSNFYKLQDGGSAPATATTGTGWTVGTTSANWTSDMEAGVERAAATFADNTTSPSPNNTLGNGWRTESAYTGRFEGGTWDIRISLVAVTSGGDQDIAIIFSLGAWSSATGAGSPNTELGFGAGTLTLSDLAVGVPQEIVVSTTLLPAILNNEYVFFTIKCWVRGSGGAADRDALIRVGSASRILTPDFTPGQFGILPVAAMAVAAPEPGGGFSHDLPEVAITIAASSLTVSKSVELPTVAAAVSAPAVAESVNTLVPVVAAVSAPAISTENTSAALDVQGIVVATLAPTATHDEDLPQQVVALAASALETNHLEELTPQAIAITGVAPDTTELIALPAVSFAVASGSIDSNHLSLVDTGGIAINSALIVGQRHVDLPAANTTILGLAADNTHLEDLGPANITLATPASLRGVVAYLEDVGVLTFVPSAFSVIKADLLPGIVQAITAPSPTINRSALLEPVSITVRTKGLMGEPDPERVGDILCAEIYFDGLDAELMIDSLDADFYTDRLAGRLEPEACEC